MTAAQRVEAFVEAMRPELERQVDEVILSVDDPADRAVLMRNREQILRQYRDATRIANLQHRLAELEERQRLRVVHVPA